MYLFFLQWIQKQTKFTLRVHLFSLFLCGFSPGTPTSSHSPHYDKKNVIKFFKKLQMRIFLNAH